MQPHPENSGPLNELMKSISNMETVPIKCKCGADTVINAAYAQYVKGPLDSCSNCR